MFRSPHKRSSSGGKEKRATGRLHLQPYPHSGGGGGGNSMASVARRRRSSSSVDPRGDFPAWLASRGMKPTFAEAMERELGISDYGELLACALAPQVRVELFAAAKERLPFAFYAVLRRIADSLVHEEGGTGDGGSVALGGLVETIVAMLSALSDALHHAAQRFISLEPGIAAGEELSQSESVKSEIAVAAAAAAATGESSSPLRPGEDCGVLDDSVSEHLGCAPRNSAHWDVVKSETDGQQQQEEDISTMEDQEPLSENEPWSRLSEGGFSPRTAVAGAWRPQPDAGPCVEDGFPLAPRPDGALLGPPLAYDGTNWRDDSRWPYTDSSADRTFLYDGGGGGGGLNPPSMVFRYRFLWRQQQQQQQRRRQQQQLQQAQQVGVDGAERPYVCEDCGKGFGSPAHLRQHRGTHTGEKRYACAECGKAFVHHASLYRHRRGHAGAKRYRCGRCAKEFRCEESLQQHLLLHT